MVVEVEEVAVEGLADGDLGDGVRQQGGPDVRVDHLKGRGQKGAFHKRN